MEIEFSEEDFKPSLDFLELDLYDWIKENLKVYFREP